MSLYLQLVSVGILYLLYCVFRTISALRRYPSAPGPKLAPFTHWWLLLKVWGGGFTSWDIQQHAKHGPVIRVAPNMYSLDSLEAARIIYSTTAPLAKANYFRAFGFPLDRNHNLFSAQDIKVHAQMRRMVANFYSMTTIKSYESYVNDCISALLTQFDKMATQGDSVNLQHWMQCYAFDVIGQLTFSHRIGFLDSGGKDVDDIMRLLDVQAKFCSVLGFDFRLFPLLVAMYGDPVQGGLRFGTKLMKLREKQGVEIDQDTEDFFSKIQKLREQDPENYKKYKCENAIQANVGAGSDTTSISLTAILYYLLKNPEKWRKLKKEVTDAVLRGDMANPITFEQAQNLQYLQAVIKEGLRLHPAVGLPQWRVVPKGGLTITGTFFPEKTIIGIDSWVASHNSQVFGEDHNIFRPERWMTSETSQEQLAQMEKYYLPFGGGTRTCAGRHIAMLEMMKLIPELVRRYEFELLTSTLTYYSYIFVRQREIQVRLISLK